MSHWFSDRAEQKDKEMTLSPNEQLHALIQYFEAIGCWYLAAEFRKSLKAR